jgi:hypothetical protein
VRLNEIAGKYRQQVDFYCIYIQEAHPQNGWQVEANIEQDILYDQPETIEAREEIAQVCALRLSFTMPMLLDDMTNQVDRLYNALPERLYLIGADGRVVFKTVAGSVGFDPEAWLAAIDALTSA